MHEPDDFGLTPVQTLSRVADPTPCKHHSVFWRLWYDAVTAESPELQERRETDPSDTGATHDVSGLRHVRVGARLLSPPSGMPVRAGLVTLHGYAARPFEDEDRRWQRLVDRGVEVLSVRVRGYPGSQLDTGDLTNPPDGGGWISHGLAAASDRPDLTLDWVFPQAVADVVNACRVMRRRLVRRGPARAPLFVHGESFGGALAVLASGLLAGRLMGEQIIDRLVIGLPTMGDWPWRFGHRSGGMGADVARTLTRHADREPELRDRLRLMDTVVHGSRVRSPTLCKLAERDDVVPAPTAASVFNALRADPACKWRFIVPYGHFDGGLANARRHLLFDRCVDEFLDPAVPASRAIAAWEPLLITGERPPDGAAVSLAEDAG